MLKASKPQFWFASVWLYVLPTAGLDVFYTINFWAGLFYFTLPFNLLMRSVPLVEKKVKATVLALQLPFLLYLAFQCWPFIIWWLAALWFVITAKGTRSGRRLLSKVLLAAGWLLPFNLSVKLNGLIPVPFETWILLLLLAFAGKLVYDLLYSGQSALTQKIILICLLFACAALIYIRFEDLYIALLFAGFALLLLTDLCINKNRLYSIKTVRIFTICANIAAAATMVWLWHSGSLMM